jgi:outer membrane protein assembly factor BamB
MTAARRRILGSSGFACAVTSACALLATCAPGTASVQARRAALAADDDLATMDADALRTGWYPNQPLLDPDAVQGRFFGQVFDAPVNGQIYAQPLVANGVVFVATETNDVYGLDPMDGSVLWTRNLGEPWHPSDFNCNDLVPSIGVTGTPAIDTSTGTAYLLAKGYGAGVSGPAIWQAHALDVLTGDERAGFPVTIAGVADNDPSQPFDPTHHMQRPGLLLLGDTIYAAFGAHCDIRAYAGWVIGISKDGRLTTLWSTEAGQPRTDGGGIWMSGAGLVSDGPGQILFTTGNDFAPTPAPTNGHTPPQKLGEAVVRLTVGPDGKLAATDFFAPYNLAELNLGDADLGSGGPVALPARFGTAAHPNLLVQAGKTGNVYLLDRDDLGGFAQGPGGGDKALQVLGPLGGVWSKPAVWPGDEGYVYVPVAAQCPSSTDNVGCLRAYRYGVTADGMPQLAPAGTSVDSFGYGSSNVVVTSDGTRSGSALLWSLWSSGWYGAGAQLRAYDAVPVDGALKLRLLMPIGTSAKFTAPTVGDAHIYVGTRDGHVLGFGFTNAVPLRASGTALPTVFVGDSAAGQVTLQAAEPLDVTGLQASGAFVLSPPAPLPASLRGGENLSVPILFSPTVDGLNRGTLAVTTDHGTFTFALVGGGQVSAPNVVEDPPLLVFDDTALGTNTTLDLTLTNDGDTPVVLEGVVPPSPPFAVETAPDPGSILLPGESTSITATFAPSLRGNFVDALTLTFDTGSLVVPLEGVALAPGRLRITPTAINAGGVYSSDHFNATFRLTNIGDSPTTLVTSIPPAGGVFIPTSALGAGTVIQPGQSIDEVMRVSPVATGAASDTWQLAANDGQGSQTITMTVSGVVNTPTPAEPTPDGSTAAETDAGAPASTAATGAAGAAEPSHTGADDGTGGATATGAGEGSVVTRTSSGCSAVPGGANVGELGLFAAAVLIGGAARRRRASTESGS